MVRVFFSPACTEKDIKWWAVLMMKMRYDAITGVYFNGQLMLEWQNLRYIGVDTDDTLVIETLPELPEGKTD